MDESPFHWLPIVDRLLVAYPLRIEWLGNPIAIIYMLRIITLEGIGII